MMKLGKIINFRVTPEQQEKLEKIMKFKNVSCLLRDNLDIVLNKEYYSLLAEGKIVEE